MSAVHVHELTEVPDVPDEVRQAALKAYTDAVAYYAECRNIDFLQVARDRMVEAAWRAGYRAGWDDGDIGLSDMAIDSAVETEMEAAWGKATEAVDDLAVRLAPVLRSEHPFDRRNDAELVVAEVLRVVER